jgi:hypothetical protein
LDETSSQVYLGVVLDQRLTFKSHAQAISNRALERLKLLNRLTSSTWGASLHTVITTYKVYIIPVLMYGSELMICASDSTNKQIELVQNKALRIITGAVKTTPITAMEIITGIMPVKLARESAALKMYERIIRVPNNLFKNYKPAEARLPSKVSFIDKIKKIYEKYDLESPRKVRRFTSNKESRKFNKMFTKSKEKITAKLSEEREKRHKENAEGKD